jgi:hypothetical protein
VAGLDAAKPTGADPKSEGDDHLRLIKTVLKNSFAGFPGVVACAGSEAQGATVNDYVVTVAPAPAAYTAAMLVVFKAGHANTGPATVKINSLSAEALKDGAGGALAAGDVPAGAIVVAQYDGTDFLLVSATDRAFRAGDTYAGAHDFTAAAISVPTASGGDADTSAASTGFVDAWFAKKASPALTGAPTAPTAAPGTNTTQIATTEFATQLAFQAALPVQTGEDGKFLQTDGTDASWQLPIPAQIGNSGKFLKTDGASANWVYNPAAPEIIIQDQRPSGTAGQSLSNLSWNTRILNTVVRNVAGATLASNQVTLATGTWVIRATTSASAILNASSVRFAPRLYNATDSATIAMGISGAALPTANNGEGGTVTMTAIAVVTLAAPKAIEVQLYVKGITSTGAVGGQPVASGEVEVYTSFEATRVD